MNSLKLKNKSIFLFLVLPGLFFADILYGLAIFYSIDLPVTPGVVLRGVLLTAALLLVFVNHRKAERAEITWLLVLILFALPGLLIGLAMTGDVAYNSSSLLKVLYLPVVSVFFIIYFSRLKVSSSDILGALEISAYFLGISLIASQLLGIQKETYGDYAFGSTGVFYAQNDLTLAFGLSLLAATYRLVFVKLSIIRLFLLVSSLIACLRIGTNASLAMPVIIVCVLLSVYILGGVRSSLASYLIKFFFLASASCVFLYIFLQVLDIYFSYDYQARKIEALLRGESSRTPLTSAAEQYISQRSFFLDIFGEGFDSFHRGVSSYFRGLGERRIVESDPYDIFGAHGLLFACAIYLYLYKFFAVSLRSAISSRAPAIYVLISSAVFLYVFYSVLVGHALTSPIPSTLLAAYLASFYVAKKESEAV